jgi:hypothetical protein
VRNAERKDESFLDHDRSKILKLKKRGSYGNRGFERGVMETVGTGSEGWQAEGRRRCFGYKPGL